MSRPKRVTVAVTRICHEEAIRRISYRSNKELSREIKNRLGITLTPEYLGKLVAEEAHRIKAEREFFLRADVSCGTNEIVDSCGTISR